MRAPQLLTVILLCASACSASRISGTYIRHDANCVEMLQLTETANGQVSGVISWIGLNADGTVRSDHAPVAGAVDSNQLTLKIGGGLSSFLFGSSLSGTVHGERISLQSVDSHGTVSSDTYVRGPSDAFQTSANQLKAKGEAISFSRKLTEGARQLKDAVQRSEEWIKAAELHAKRIPRIKGDYEAVEQKMQALLVTEHNSGDPVAKAQISVAVSQGDIAGGQIDIAVNQLWDVNIADTGSQLNSEFAKWDGQCSSTTVLQQRGATAQSAEAWVNACKQAVAERTKFTPIYKQIMNERAMLKSFQVAAEHRRKQLVAESNEIE